MPMSSANNSDSSSGEPEMPPGPAMNPPADGFRITTQDSSILKGYMNEFEQGDTPMRNKIIERAMGELYKLWPGNSSFDKKQDHREGHGGTI
jgi:hypothetical protein